MKILPLIVVSLFKLAFGANGGEHVAGRLSDKCEDDTWCKVNDGMCDAKIQKCVCKDGFVQNSLHTCVKATRLGEVCMYDVQCQWNDHNRRCSSSHDQRFRLVYKCTCKLSYHLEIVNNTEKCILGKIAEDEKEGLTAAPIILCFMGCVVVEAFCLLAFRYWKKHRRAELRRNENLPLEPHRLTDTCVPGRPPHPSTFISFMMSPIDMRLTGSGLSSPPPYNQTEMTRAATSEQSEEPPPSYEEAMKQCIGAPALSTPVATEMLERRKMSC